MRMLEYWLPTTWHWLLLMVEVLAAGTALVHVVLRKNDPRAAAYWVAIIALVPILGAVLYLFLGINLIRRAGRHYREVVGHAGADSVQPYMPQLLPEYETEVQSMEGLVHSLRTVSRMSLLGGNTVEVLRDGDETYPAMLGAIDNATKTISLCSYIFELKGPGMKFVQALERAVQRGVQVRVLVDDAGTRYSWPPVTGEMKKRGIPVQRFMPNRFIGRLLTMNLRNHRKIMVVDGTRGFTGGINIRAGHVMADAPAHPARDLHFAVRGPVVGQLQRMFAEDWAFCTGEWISGEDWFPEHETPGDVSAIGLPDGPDADIDTNQLAIATALDEARRDVRIMTPYFLPPDQIFSALMTCALRGVRVRILLPGKNNLPFVQWASRTMYGPLLQRGCRVFEGVGPFDHSKLMTVDGKFSLIGSTNWDPRSLRLNFEFNLGCFDDRLAHRLNTEFDARMRGAAEITPEWLASRPLGERLRGGVARLFTPLL
jgi:cardiolipin synthase A/B